MRVIVAAACAVALIGCQAQCHGDRAPMAATDSKVAGLAGEAASEAAPEAPQQAQAQTPGQTGGAQFMAYVYGMTLELPAKHVQPVMQGHINQCEAAGPRVCQILNSNISSQGEDRFYATLSLRAEPKWVATYRAGLKSDAEKVNGRVRNETRSAEDLTREIVDSEARLRAQKTLRDRLGQILRERPGKLQEVLDTERELARVQGEIDSLESSLAVMRERVTMSILNLDYHSRDVPVAGGTFDPISAALNDFVGLMATVVAFLIRAIAFIVPIFLIVGVPLIFFLRARTRRRLALEEKERAGF